jgi:hypothetical protein
MIFERKAFLLFTGLFASAIAASCLDTAPITVASSSNVSSQSRECAACYVAPNVPGPGCADEVTACFADPKCKKAFQCSVDRGCFQGAKEQLITCGTDCASQAGFTSLADTAYALATKVYACLLGPCKDACFGPSTGPEDAGLDAAAEAAICGAPNAQNNELGYGGYCKSTSDCTNEAGLFRLCAADFGGGNFCTGPCETDEECGSGEHCAHAAQGSGCVPLACQLPTAPGVADGAAE